MAPLPSRFPHPQPACWNISASSGEQFTASLVKAAKASFRKFSLTVSFCSLKVQDDDCALQLNQEKGEVVNGGLLLREVTLFVVWLEITITCLDSHTKEKRFR